MPSRRQVLASTASVAAAGFGGCLTDLGLAKTGYLQYKIVDVRWSDGARTWSDDVLWASSDGESEIDCRVAEEFEEVVNSPTDIHASDEFHRRLERTFTEVTYVAGFCWEGPDGLECQNPQASREGFNAVQFGDRAEVRFEHPDVHVLDVYEDAQGTAENWERESRTYSFADLHEDHGVPLDSA